MKNILIISERFHPEEFLINDLAKEWQKTGHKITVLTQQPSYPFGILFKDYKNKIFSKENWNGITIHRFFTITGYQKNLFLKILNYLNFLITGTLFALVIGRKFDKIFVYQTGPLTQAIPAVITKIIWRNSQITIWTQDVWPDTVFAYGFKRNKLLVWSLDKLVKFVYKHCTNILISCKGFKEKISSYCKDQKNQYFPNWPITNLSDVCSSKINFSSGMNFTFTGNIGKVQNLENVVIGFFQFASNHHDVFLHLIGDGSNLDNLKDLVKNSENNNIIFWGRHSIAEMPDFHQKSDVLIISLINRPIFSLTVPSKFQAYLKAQKPIFCIVEGEVKKLTLDNNLGLCANPDDINEIASIFERFYYLKQNKLLDNFSKNSSKLLENEFNRERIIKEMLKIVIS